MATQVHPARGMRDFLPVEKRRRERVLRVIRDAYEDHGFEEIETPVVEDAARLHAGLGGDNEKLAFAVMRRGLSLDDLRAAEAPLELRHLLADRRRRHAQPAGGSGETACLDGFQKTVESVKLEHDCVLLVETDSIDYGLVRSNAAS